MEKNNRESRKVLCLGFPCGDYHCEFLSRDIDPHTLEKHGKTRVYPAKICVLSCVSDREYLTRRDKILRFIYTDQKPRRKTHRFQMAC